MSSRMIKILIVLFIPLLMGIGIGYLIKPTTAESAAGASDEQFPGLQQTVYQQEGEAATVQDQVNNSRHNAITRAVARVSPAVVGINVIEVRQFRDPFYDFFPNDPFFRRFFGDRTFQQQVRGLGSGFIISPDGYIVTNDHVAGNAKEVTVTLTTGEKLKAEIVGTDQLTDICLLKVDAKNLPSVTLGNSDDIIIGEWAIALGNPFGLFDINDKPTVTVGVISSVGMNLGRVDSRIYKDMIETDAAINSGNSGGPLVNSLGEVIGMNTLIYTGGRSETYVGYGFAIPVNKVKKVVAELRSKGKVTRDFWTGFESQPVDARVARYFGLSRVEGIIVSDVASGSPAEKAGLKVGDIILEANGTKVNSEQDLIALLVDARAGDTIRMKVYRERKIIDVALRLERRPA
ncbi:MAG TPA: trypsin-like peptidase domain-containing protein [Bacteroidota bacterium]|nr:trypsin-like peptidase domain-containing protein [Bacteroidota bacterium]